MTAIENYSCQCLDSFIPIFILFFSKPSRRRLSQFLVVYPVEVLVKWSSPFSGPLSVFCRLSSAAGVAAENEYKPHSCMLSLQIFYWCLFDDCVEECKIFYQTAFFFFIVLLTDLIISTLDWHLYFSYTNVIPWYFD